MGQASIALNATAKDKENDTSVLKTSAHGGTCPRGGFF